MAKIKKLIHWIHITNVRVGAAISWLTFLMAVLITIEVISRYVFKSPTTWSWLINKNLLGLFILYAGVYTLSQDQFIRIDILSEKLPASIKNITRYIGFICFLIFIGCLIWKGTEMAWFSLSVKEKAKGLFPLPLYPLKILIPAISILFLLEGIIIFFRSKD